jgi:hypothetical protein
MPKTKGGAPNKKKISADEVYRFQIVQKKMSSVVQPDAEKGEFLEGAASGPSPSTQLAHLEQLGLGGGADTQDTTVHSPPPGPESPPYMPHSPTSSPSGPSPVRVPSPSSPSFTFIPRLCLKLPCPVAAIINSAVVAESSEAGRQAEAAEQVGLGISSHSASPASNRYLLARVAMLEEEVCILKNKHISLEARVRYFEAQFEGNM